MENPVKGGACPLTRAEFREHARPLQVSVEGKGLLAQVKEFGTGSLGWFACEKVVLLVAGKPVRVQANLSLTIIGSKELPRPEGTPPGDGELPPPARPGGRKPAPRKEG